MLSANVVWHSGRAGKVPLFKSEVRGSTNIGVIFVSCFAEVYLLIVFNQTEDLDGSEMHLKMGDQKIDFNVIRIAYL